jgi:aldehyde dehydrogenase (NAD+)
MNTETVPSAALHIGHERVWRSSGGAYQHLHPVTQAPQASIPLAGKAEMDRAIDKAAQAFESWRTVAPEVRRDILLRLSTLMRENNDELARMAAIDGGVPVARGRQMAGLAADFHTYYAGWPDKLGGELLSTYDQRRELVYTMAEPYGVVGVITTWNGPMVSMGMKVAPALAAGNCVVVKPSELTPFACDLYARLASDAGVPDGVLSILIGDATAGEALVRHPQVEKISFTGGISSARKILAACAEQVKPAVLELGGKSASLIFPDADLDQVCQYSIGFTIGVMAGQGCALPTRVIVHESIYDEVLGRLVAIARGYKVGDPFDPDVIVGPLINAAACDRVMAMLDSVRAEKSGDIILGGNRCGGDLAGKNFIEPTIIVDVDPNSEIAQVEIFGPVVIVQRFSTEEEAIALANATRYGLAAYIHSNDLRRVHRLAERLKSGGVYVNGANTVAPHLPFGGLGVSGYGKEGGRAGIDEFLRYKTVAIG